MAGINLLRFVLSLQQRDFLTGLLPVPLLYLTLSGLVWAVTGLVLGFGLWSGSRFAVWGVQLAALLYTLYYWIDRTLVAADAPGRDWLFAALVNLVVLAAVAWIPRRPVAKAFFGALHDPEPEG